MDPIIQALELARFVEYLAKSRTSEARTFREAVDAFHACQNIDPTSPQGFEAEAANVGADDVADLIQRVTDHQLREPVAGVARNIILGLIARRVIRGARSAGPELIVTIKSDFDEKAGAFTDIVRTLPDGYADPSRLLEAGPEAVDAFHQARTLAATLDRYRAVRDRLAFEQVLAAGDETVECGTRYTDVTNTIDARRVATITVTNPLGFFGEALTVPGVNALHWLTLEDHADYIARLPEGHERWQRAKVDGFWVNRREETVAS